MFSYLTLFLFRDFLQREDLQERKRPYHSGLTVHFNSSVIIIIITTSSRNNRDKARAIQVCSVVMCDSISVFSQVNLCFFCRSECICALAWKFWSKNYSITGLDRPLDLQEVEDSRYLDNQHTKVTRLSAIRTGRLYHQKLRYVCVVHYLLINVPPNCIYLKYFMYLVFFSRFLFFSCNWPEIFSRTL